jgi:hypothetical protein
MTKLVKEAFKEELVTSYTKPNKDMEYIRALEFLLNYVQMSEERQVCADGK